MWSTLRCRGGGHSYQGYSVAPGAVTISLDWMNATTVGLSGSCSVVGFGERSPRHATLMFLPVAHSSASPMPLALPQVAADQKTAVMQGGSRFGQLYYNVWEQAKGAKAAVGGTCPPVGAGALLGGGLGPLTREHGMGCDSFVSARMVRSVRVCVGG